MRISIILLLVCISIAGYSQLSPFHDKIQDRWGYKNAAGEIIIAPQYYRTFNFSEGLAAIIDCKFWYDEETKEYITHVECNAWFINEDGEKVLDFPKEVVPARGWIGVDMTYEFHEGLVKVHHNVSGKAGFMDRSGNIVIPFRYDVAGDFSEGKVFAAVLTNWYMEQVGKNQVGYLNKRGRWIFKLEPELANLANGCYFFGGRFENGMAEMNIMENDGDCVNWGKIVVDKKGRIVERDFY